MTQSIPLGDDVRVRLQRTLRVPDDGGDHPLPPSLGAMAVTHVDTLSPGAREVLGVGDARYVVALRDGEALWLDFDARHWHPSALKVGLGTVCAVTGETYEPARLGVCGQDYLVVPDQPWLDGVATGEGFVRQFVATALGTGATVEEQLSDDAHRGGLRFATFAATPGRFPEAPPPEPECDGDVMCCMAPALGLAAGGRIRQEIYDDHHGPGTWEQKPVESVEVALVEATAFAAVTSLPVPSEPIDAATYTAHGFPWFELHDPRRQALDVAAKLEAIRSLAELRGTRDAVLVVDPEQVIALLNAAVAVR
ncbi:MAG: hypothetical protein WKF96_07665 [Solirubrobacteraceae bacterium]